MKNLEFPSGEFKISIPGRGAKFKNSRFRMGTRGLEIFIGFGWAKVNPEILQKIKEGKYHIRKKG